MKRFLQKSLFQGALAFGLLMTASSWGQSIFSNEITGTNPNEENPYTTGQVVDENITVSGIGRGEGINGTNANNRYNANGWDTADFDDTAYFEFVLTPNEGYEIDFTDLVVTIQRSGSGPAQFAIRSSADGFMVNLYSIASPETNTFTATVDLSDPVFQNVDEEITFRLYGWDTTNATGTGSVNDFTFNGVVEEGCGVLPGPVAGAQLFCGAATVSELEVEGTEDIFVYASEDGTEVLTGDTELITGTYYISQMVGSCESERTEVEVTIVMVDAPEGEEMQTFNAGQTLADLTVTGDNLVWYSDEALENEIQDTTELVDGVTYYVVATEGICVSETLAITVDEVLGTGSFTMAGLTYYPNPVNDVLNVSYTESLSAIVVYNLVGQSVIVKELNAGTASVDMSQLAAGSYIAKITSGSQTKTIKIVKN